jgi:hypothetical protein
MPKKELKFKLEKMQIRDGSEIEVLKFDDIGVEGDGAACCICNLRLRKGQHSWFVHKYNGSNIILPVEPEALWNDYSISQGASAIGAECRKQLPPQFVKKRETQEEA